jgi:hypothetical protein
LHLPVIWDLTSRVSVELAATNARWGLEKGRRLPFRSL